MLKILVCVKQVPDVDQMRMDPETGNLIRAGVPAILNPLDANALSAAVKVKETYGAEITLITMGPPAAEAVLRECLAVGADKAILVTDRAFGNADTLATSYSIVSAANTAGKFDLIFCGKETLDGATGQMGSQLAERFDAGLKGIDAARAHLYSVCEQNDVGITVMKGFAGGRLFDEKRSPFGVCLTPVQCIHYALTRPAVCSILCGYDTKEQVDAAVAYETASAEEKDYASVLANAPFHSYRGECTYCGHCKPCAVQLDIAMINKFYDLATMQPEVPATVRSHYEALEHTASACIGCRSCKVNCPSDAIRLYRPQQED